MPPGKQAKEVKIEFKMEVNKMVSAMKDVQKSFQESTQNIDKMSDSFKNMETKLHLVNMKMADMTKNISAMTQTNMVMSKDIKESFSQWGTLLNYNNQKITSAITKMIQLNKQNQARAEQLAKEKALLKDNESSLSNTFLRLKSWNLIWNAIYHNIQKAFGELDKLNHTVAVISKMSGENKEKLADSIFGLSNKSGQDINDIAKALQDSTNEGNSLANSFEKVNAGIILSTKNMGSLSNSIARIDDIVDQFGVSADQALGIVLGKNISSERSLAVFGRLARDAKEAGLDVQMLSSTISVMANEAGIAERSLQIGFRAIMNGLQDIGNENQKIFFEKILPNWNKLDDATKRQTEKMLHLRQNDEFLKQWGERYERIVEVTNNYITNQDEINKRAREMPVTTVMQWNQLWNDTLFIINQTTGSFYSLILKAGEFLGIIQTIHTIAEGLKGATVGLGEAGSGFTKDENLKDLINLRNQVTQRLLTMQDKYETGNLGNEYKSLDELKQKITESEKRERELSSQIKARMGQLLSEKRHMQEVADTLGITKPQEAPLSPFDKMNLDGRTGALKDVVKFYKEMADDIGIAVRRQELQEELDHNKIASLREQIALWKGAQKTFEGEINLQKGAHPTEPAYWDELLELQARAHNKELAAKKRLAEELDKVNKSSIRENKKDSLENDKLLIEKIDLKKQELKLAFENKTINSVEYSSGLLQLNSMLVTMKDRNRAQEISNKLGIDSVKILEDRSELIKSIELSISKMNNKEPDVERKQDQDLRKITLQKRRAGRLTPADELKLLQEEATERRRIAGPLGVQQVRQKAEMEMHAYQQLADQFAQQGLANEARTQLAKAELIKQTRDKQIQAILDAETAESASLQKRREEWDRTHFTWREAGEATGQMLKSSLEQSIDVLITKTGSLKDVWKSFESQLLSMFAREALMQGIRMLLDFGGVTRAGKGFFSSVVRGMGFSSGTGVGGVPGYASGTGMMGTDTIPAMLTPGEIVLDRNASDVFRGMAANGGGMGGPTVIVVQSYPSLLGNKEELIRLDTALNNPSIRTSTDRRKV